MDARDDAKITAHMEAIDLIVVRMINDIMKYTNENREGIIKDMLKLFSEDELKNVPENLHADKALVAFAATAAMVAYQKSVVFRLAMDSGCDAVHQKGDGKTFDTLNDTWTNLGKKLRPELHPAN